MPFSAVQEAGRRGSISLLAISQQPLEFRIGGQSKTHHIAASMSQDRIDTPMLIALTQHQRGSAVSLEKEFQVNKLQSPELALRITEISDTKEKPQCGSDN